MKSLRKSGGFFYQSRFQDFHLYIRCMRWMNVLTLAAATVIITACFLPWVTIVEKDLTVTGMQAEAIGLGKPGLVHLFFSALFILFVLLNRPWSLRTAFFISAFNFAWALRNYISFSACSGGECPVKRFGLYLILLSAIATAAFLLLIRQPVDKN
jgi:hypothetical protein